MKCEYDLIDLNSTAFCPIGGRAKSSAAGIFIKNIPRILEGKKL